MRVTPTPASSSCLLALLFVLSLGQGFAQAQGWQVQTLPALPAGSTYQLTAVSAISPTQVWVAGNIAPSGDGFVARSTDGGATWALVQRSADFRVNRLAMLRSDMGFVAGNFDFFKSTTDGGLTWVQERNNLCCAPPSPIEVHNVGPGGHLYGLAVADDGHIWTAGWDGYGAGVIYHRVPERPQPSPPTNPNQPWWLEWAANYTGMYGIAAANTSVAWAAGYLGNIWKTVDGGVGWGKQASPTGAALNDVNAIDTLTAWAVGDSGTIVKTTDGGDTWTLQTAPTGDNLRRIAAVSAQVAWVVGANGLILHTTDGGATWVRQFSGTRGALTGVSAVSATTAWVVGADGTLIATTDGGTGTWPAPTISSVSPVLAGQQPSNYLTATITGTGLRGGAVRVLFGSEESTLVTWVDTSTLQARVPAGMPGTCSLTVINEDGQAVTLPAAVTFLPRPVMTAYSPFHGPAAGGYQITVDGYNLQSVSSARLYIQFKTLPYELNEALTVTAVNSTRVLVDVPVSATRPVGRAYLTLFTAENQDVSGDHFVLDPPGGATFAIDTISPRQGLEGTTVTVTGVGFLPTAYLDVCGNDLTMASRSATQLVGVLNGFNSGRCRVQVQNEEDDIEVDPGFLWTSLTPLAVSQVSPASGLPAGGTLVTITGSGFAQTYATDVSFDGYPATVTSRTNTQLVVVSPPHALGAVDVFVMPTDGGGPVGPVTRVEGGFTYSTGPPALAPTLTAIAPSAGPIAGATAVTLTGTNFVAGATVTLGGVPATDVLVASATKITATTPARVAGTVDVRVSNPDGQSATLAAAYTYAAPQPQPAITGIYPAAGDIHGGTLMTITGTNFGVLAPLLAGGAVAMPAYVTPTVAVGGAAATFVTVVNATTITCRAPALLAGSARDVVLTWPGGASAQADAAYTPMDVAASAGHDTDGDTMPDDWELVFGFDPLSPADSGADADGDGRTNAQECAAHTHPAGAAARYFAEGATTPFFDTSIALANPFTIPASVNLRFLKRDGSLAAHALRMLATSRATVDPKTLAGMDPAEFATTIESDLAIAVDRTMRWAGGSHAERSLPAPGETWYLAEGATHSGFDLFYLLQNPNATAADVRVRYLLPGGAPLEKRYTVEPNSRFNIWVDYEEFPAGSGNLALADTDVSAVVEVQNAVPIIVERAMYLSRGGQTFLAGHESAGVVAPALEWFLAEGATGPYFDLFILLANPSPTDAEVEARYLLSSGQVVTKTYRVAGESRFNIWVDLEGPALADAAVSTALRVTNGVPIIVERAMWWPGGFTTWTEAHNSPGSTVTGTVWMVAEGEVKSATNLETYLLVANTSATPAEIDVTLLFEDGTIATRHYTVAADSRFNVPVGLDFAEAAGKRFGAVVESLGASPAQIVVERAMYYDEGGVFWAAGSNALATRVR